MGQGSAALRDHPQYAPPHLLISATARDNYEKEKKKPETSDENTGLVITKAAPRPWGKGLEQGHNLHRVSGTRDRRNRV